LDFIASSVTYFSINKKVWINQVSKSPQKLRCHHLLGIMFLKHRRAQTFLSHRKAPILNFTSTSQGTADLPIRAGTDHEHKAQSRKLPCVKTLKLSGRPGVGSIRLKNKPDPD